MPATISFSMKIITFLADIMFAFKIDMDWLSTTVKWFYGTNRYSGTIDVEFQFRHIHSQSSFCFDSMRWKNESSSIHMMRWNQTDRGNLHPSRKKINIKYYMHYDERESILVYLKSLTISVVFRTSLLKLRSNHFAEEIFFWLHLTILFPLLTDGQKVKRMINNFIIEGVRQTTKYK